MRHNPANIGSKNYVGLSMTYSKAQFNSFRRDFETLSWVWGLNIWTLWNPATLIHIIYIFYLRCTISKGMWFALHCSQAFCCHETVRSLITHGRLLLQWDNNHCFLSTNTTWACVKLFEQRDFKSRWAQTAVWNIPKQIYYKPYWSILKVGHLRAVCCVSALPSENGISQEKLKVAKPAKCFHKRFLVMKTSLSAMWDCAVILGYIKQCLLCYIYFSTVSIYYYSCKLTKVEIFITAEWCRSGFKKRSR